MAYKKKKADKAVPKEKMTDKVKDGEAKEVELSNRCKLWKGRVRSYEKDAADYLSEGKKAWAEALDCRDELSEHLEGVSRGDERIYSHVTRYVESSYFSRLPEVIASGDFAEEDEGAIVAAFSAERAGNRFVKQETFCEAIDGAKGDYVHTSRGVARIYLSLEEIEEKVKVRVFEQEVPPPPTSPEELMLDPQTGGLVGPSPEESPQAQIVLVDEEGEEVLGDEEIQEDEEGLYVERGAKKVTRAYPYLKHVAFTDYYHTPRASCKKQVTWEVYRVKYGKGDFVKKWGKEKWEELVQVQVESGRHQDEEKASSVDFVEVSECWDIEKKTVECLCLDGSGVYLETKVDPYGIKGFFPSILVVSGKKNDRLWGLSDFANYREKLDHIKELNRRRVLLQSYLNRNGIGNGRYKDELQALNEMKGDGRIIFVDQFNNLVTDAQGQGGFVQFFPVAEYVQAFQEVNGAYNEAKAEYYEYFGLDMLMQTGGAEVVQDEQAQRQSVGLLYTTRMRKFQEFVKDSIRQLEDTALHVLPEDVYKTLIGFSYMPEGYQALWPEAYEILTNDYFRCIRIDIDTDSTVALTKEMEAGQQMQLFQTVQQSLGPLTDVAQTKPEFVAPLASIVMAAVQGMKGGKSRFGGLNSAFKQLIEMASQPPQEEQAPDPALMKAESQRILAEHKVSIENREQEFKEFIEQEKLSLEQYVASISAKEKMIEEGRLAEKQAINMAPKLASAAKKNAETELIEGVTLGVQPAAPAPMGADVLGIEPIGQL